MAKKSTKKIKAAELKQLQELQGGINNALSNLANIEVAKHELLHDHSKMKAEMNELTASLQKTYGEVNISLQDGSISEIEAK